MRVGDPAAGHHLVFAIARAAAAEKAPAELALKPRGSVNIRLAVRVER
jgi:hypothetical protein